MRIGTQGLIATTVNWTVQSAIGRLQKKDSATAYLCPILSEPRGRTCTSSGKVCRCAAVPLGVQVSKIPNRSRFSHFMWTCRAAARSVITLSATTLPCASILSACKPATFSFNKITYPTAPGTASPFIFGVPNS